MNQLHLSPVAQADLTEIKEYISEDLENPIAATSTVSKIMEQIRSLSGQAFIGTPLSAITDIESDYRFLVSGNYLIFYRAMAQRSTLTGCSMAAGTTYAYCLTI